jgi:hypothetical protein
VLFVSLWTSPPLYAEDVPHESVRKPDPRTGEFVAVPGNQIQPGKIYNHYSQRQGRYVWAYATESGGFSYGLGPGSTEDPANFDVVTSERETRRIVQENAGPWASRSREQGRPILIRLGDDDKWKVLPGKSIRSHFDIDSGRRWEWHGTRRVAVVHTHGYHWSRGGERYVPAVDGVLCRSW